VDSVTKVKHAEFECNKVTELLVLAISMNVLTEFGLGLVLLDSGVCFSFFCYIF